MMDAQFFYDLWPVLALVVFLVALVAWWLVGFEVLRRASGLGTKEFIARVQQYPGDPMTAWLGILLWPWTLKWAREDVPDEAKP